MSNESEETTQPQSSEKKTRTYFEFKLENDDGTLTKIMEYELLSAPRLEPSDQKDSVSLLIPLRIETFQPTVLNQELHLTLNQELVREMAERLGLLDS